jgi:hypothetical protein
VATGAGGTAPAAGTTFPGISLVLTGMAVLLAAGIAASVALRRRAG